MTRLAKYRLRGRQLGSEARIYTLTIPNRAFLEQRVSYQDAPLICFLRLERELCTSGDSAMPASQLRITDTELADYRMANTKKAAPRRRRTAVET